MAPGPSSGSRRGSRLRGRDLNDPLGHFSLQASSPLASPERPSGSYPLDPRLSETPSGKSSPGPEQEALGLSVHWVKNTGHLDAPLAQDPSLITHTQTFTHSLRHCIKKTHTHTTILVNEILYYKCSLTAGLPWQHGVCLQGSRPFSRAESSQQQAPQGLRRPQPSHTAASVNGENGPPT